MTASDADIARREILVREYSPSDVTDMARAWNQVVGDGVAFPQEEQLSLEEAAAFFAAQTSCAVACDAQSGKVLGMYILHPNNVGRCGHICNTSYAVLREARGRGVGEALVRDSLVRGRECGFSILQFNAVVASNAPARHIYEKLGFVQLGVIPGGFRMPDGTFEDIVPYYHEL